MKLHDYYFSMISLPDTNSTLIKEVEWDEENNELHIIFHDKYYIKEETYLDFDYEWLDMFSTSPSLGKFYLRFIKSQFKLKPRIMAERPKTTNKSSDQKRFIDISIDVTKINNDWLFVGEKGTYLHMTLAMMPDGEIDNFGNLGMITQKVPKKVYEAELKLPKNQKQRGAILGNAAEFERKGMEGMPGAEEGEMVGNKSEKEKEEIKDDLPF